MLLADTSAWIDYLKGSGTEQAKHLRQAIVDRDVVVVDPVFLEVMAGARREHVSTTQRLLASQYNEALIPRLDWIDGATLYRELRWRGVTLRSQIDALIAAVAIRTNLPILHRDRDYDRIAEHTDLEVVPG